MSSFLAALSRQHAYPVSARSGRKEFIETKDDRSSGGHSPFRGHGGALMRQKHRTRVIAICRAAARRRATCFLSELLVEFLDDPADLGPHSSRDREASPFPHCTHGTDHDSKTAAIASGDLSTSTPAPVPTGRASKPYDHARVRPQSVLAAIPQRRVMTNSPNDALRSFLVGLPACWLMRSAISGRRHVGRLFFHVSHLL
jgi:hypothetical protein